MARSSQVLFVDRLRSALVFEAFIYTFLEVSLHLLVDRFRRCWGVSTVIVHDSLGV